MHGPADQRFLNIAGQLEKALIDLDVAHIRQPRDNSRRRVGGEGALEAILGVKLLRFVVYDQSQTIRLSIGIGYNQTAEALDPKPLPLALVHLDDDRREAVAGDYPGHRIFIRG